MNPQKFIRKDWIAASHFHPMSEREVLDEVTRRVSQGQKPVVLLDLDSTLYEVQPRTAQILKEWAESHEAREHAHVREALMNLQKHHLGYSLKDLFVNLGLKVEDAAIQAAHEVAKKFWLSRFFTDDYLKHDIAYPGAAEYARALHERGAELIYLTGRDEPGMGRGTRQNLIRDRFPWEVERTNLLMKKTFHHPDLEHKTSAAEHVRKAGNLVASFENEPVNLVALSKIFPQAMHVFVETVASDHPSEPGRDLYRIQGFESARSAN